MNVERGFSWAAGVLVMLSITAFCIADDNLGLAAFAMPVGLAAWVLSCRQARPLRLPRRAVNLVLVGIVLLAVVRAQQDLSVSVIATIAVYILLLKIGDRRGPRDDAQIVALAVFLLIASMLTSSRMSVGLLLAASGPALVLSTILVQIRAGIRAASAGAPSRTTGAPERHSIAIAPRLGITTAGAVVTIIVAAVAVFLIVPRGVGENYFGGLARREGGSVTGFSNEVRLGTRGVISTSPTVVLELAVRQASSQADTEGEPMGSANEVFYLRGAVLEDYEKGRWTARSEAIRGLPVEPNGIVSLDYERLVRGNLIRQEVFVRDTPPSGMPAYLFTLWEPMAIQIREQLKDRQLLMRGSGEALTARMNGGPFSYVVWSRMNEWSDEEPQPTEIAKFEERAAIGAEAARVLAAAGIEPVPTQRDPAENARAARAIQSWLRTNFAYTLEEAGTPEGADPIEHFLFESKRGHCEYFAAAMVAMCRSIGIQSRMVTGYVAADFNEASGTYVVRESNAHAWAEVEISRGRWRTFDATPPDDLTRLHRASPGLSGRLRHALDAIEHLWNRSVVSFDERDRASIFARGSRSRAGDAAAEFLARRLQRGGRELLLSAVLAGVGTFVAVAGVGLGAAWLIRRWWHTGEQPPGDPRRLAFYGEMLAELTRRGIGKPTWLPPRAHADTIAAVDAAASVAAEEVSRLYYRARFGGEAITADEIQAARRLLQTIRKRR
ncbi:MAG: DUF3488 and DUF4129 domain-containing transglutaminase family protein [Phycisphaerales bacterium]